MEFSSMIPLAADIGVGVALLIALIIGAKRGLLRSLISIGVIAASLLGASWCATNLTEPVSQWLTPLIEKRVAEKSPLAGLELKLPDFLSDLVSGIQSASHGFILENVLEMLRPILYAAIYLVAFLLLLLILRLIGKALRIVEKLPIIKTCNKLGGAILGLAGGAIVISVVLWAAGRFNWLPPQTLEDSYFAKYFTASMWIHNAL